MKVSMHLPQAGFKISLELLGGYWIEQPRKPREAVLVAKSAHVPGIELTCSLDGSYAIHHGRFAQDAKAGFETCFEGETWECCGKTLVRMSAIELLTLTEGKTFTLKG